MFSDNKKRLRLCWQFAFPPCTRITNVYTFSSSAFLWSRSESTDLISPIATTKQQIAKLISVSRRRISTFFLSHFSAYFFMMCESPTGSLQLQKKTIAPSPSHNEVEMKRSLFPPRLLFQLANIFPSAFCYFSPAFYKSGRETFFFISLFFVSVLGEIDSSRVGCCSCTLHKFRGRVRG